MAEARAEREKVKGILKTGREPVQTRRLDRAAEVASSNVTFASVAEEWLRKEEATWSRVHAKKARRAIERDVLPVLGTLPVRDITPAIVAPRRVSLREDQSGASALPPPPVRQLRRESGNKDPPPANIPDRPAQVGQIS